jgi:hypothetical protein
LGVQSGTSSQLGVTKVRTILGLNSNPPGHEDPEVCSPKARNVLGLNDAPAQGGSSVANAIATMRRRRRKPHTDA